MSYTVTIKLNGGDGQIYELFSWLSQEPRLRGALHFKSLDQGEGGKQHLGPTSDVLVALLGSGGVGAVLATSLSTWIKTRRSDIRITIETKSGKIDVDAKNVKDASSLLRGLIDADY